MLALGPGLLMAGAAIGGSHLIQSTRAGADYGYSLLWVIFLALLFKYPFFEFGSRYAVATGETLLCGYMRLGKWKFYTFMIFSILSMFIITATLFIVTAGLATNFFSFAIPRIYLCLIISVVCTTILIIGHYSLLDKAMKILVSLISIITIIAVLSVFSKTTVEVKTLFPQTYWNEGGIFFIVALMGWMPAPLDLPVWQSLWSLARWKQTKYKPATKEVLFDFNLGYIITTIMALVFLSLGAMLMFGTNEFFANSGAAFAKQLSNLYAKALGGRGHNFINIGIFITMFSTTLAALDAYTRVIVHGYNLVFPKVSEKTKTKLYTTLLFLLNIVALLIVSYLRHGMKFMIDISTTIGFLQHLYSLTSIIE